jgi:hypothetical protein
MKAIVPFLLWIVLIPTPWSAAGEDPLLQASGYLKGYFLAVVPPEVEGDPEAAGQPVEGLAINRARLKLFSRPWDPVTAELAYELVPMVLGNASLMEEALLGLTYTQNLPYRLIDFDRQLYPAPEEEVGSFVLAHNLDRAFVTLSPGFADFSLGRQPISFGVARAVNPTDIFAPFTFTELDKEEKIGVDAVRARVPLGAMGELDAGLVFGHDADPDESAAFLNAKATVLRTDLTLTNIAFCDNMLFGVDLARPVGEAGFYLEAAYVFAGLLKERLSEEDYLRVSTGLDYHFSEGVYVFLEYHFSGASEGEPKEYLTQITKTAFQEGGVYLLGRNYLIPGVSYEITPLLKATLQVLVNLEDVSALFFPRLEYNLLEDVYLEAGAYVPVGREAKAALGPLGGAVIPEPESEFGLYPTLFFTSMRLYF